MPACFGTCTTSRFTPVSPADSSIAAGRCSTSCPPSPQPKAAHAFAPPTRRPARSGQQNGGLKPSGSITGGCRSTGFLDTSNTLHRHACIAGGGSTYCGHVYALYFLKDQISALGGGHRHDWEYAAIWTRDGVVTHALRFAGAGEPPENPYGQFLAPLVTSWYEQTRGSQVLPSPRCKPENCPRRHRRLPSDPTSETGVQHGIASWPPGGSPAARRA